MKYKNSAHWRPIVAVLGQQQLQRCVKQLEHQYRWWMGRLPKGHPAALHMEQVTLFQETGGRERLPAVPHLANFSPEHEAPILKVGALHFRLMAEGLRLTKTQACLLAAQGGSFAKYQPEDMDSIAEPGSPLNEELKALMIQKAADLLLGGTPWVLRDYFEAAIGGLCDGIGKVPPAIQVELLNAMSWGMPDPQAIIDDYAACLTHAYGINASVWTLNHVADKSSTPFPYHYPRTPPTKDFIWPSSASAPRSSSPSPSSPWF